MKVQQISIFLENKAGRLAEVTNLLAEAGVNIKALSLADTSEFGILRLIVDNQEKAQSVLKNNGVTVRLTDVVAAEVSHTPGGLNSIRQLRQGRGITVEYMYGLPYQHANAIMVFRLDRPELAIEVLQQSGIRIFTSDEVCAL